MGSLNKFLTMTAPENFYITLNNGSKMQDLV